MTAPIQLRSLVGAQWETAPDTNKVLDKFTGEVIALAPEDNRETVNKAVACARETFQTQFLEPYLRHEILMRARDILRDRLDLIVEEMIAETGFTRTDCHNDSQRALQTLQVTAEEAKRITGEMVPIHAAPGQSSQRLAFTLRDPVGVVAAITPFNSPLNTVCHKIAPAFAAGNATVLKPATYTPVSAQRICEIFLEAGMPPGWLNLIYGSGRRAGQWLLENQDVDYYTFTGSTGVGRTIQDTVGLRRTQLELGSISGTILCADTDLDYAIPRCVNSSFRKAGQVCTSIQRLMIERPVFEQVTQGLQERIGALIAGDPRAEGTFVGPMISSGEAGRAEAWIREAQDAGAKLLNGGARKGNVLSPTLLTDVPRGAMLVSEEAFAPVLVVEPFDTLDDAIHEVNASPYGLAGGIFTNDINKGLRAARKVRVGAFHVNDTSSSRVDLMPYGGVKQSGHGLEGPRYAIRDMTEERLITLTPTGLG